MVSERMCGGRGDFMSQFVLYRHTFGEIVENHKKETVRGLTSLKSRFEPEVFRMRKSSDALSKHVRQYAVVMQHFKLST